MPPTIRDIAARAGVSHTTVSLALRRDRRLPAATRRRIERLASELGYRRDAALGELMARLRTLRAQPAHAALGFVTAWPSRHGWRESADFEWAPEPLTGSHGGADSLIMDEFLRYLEYGGETDTTPVAARMAAAGVAAAIMKCAGMGGGCG